MEDVKEPTLKCVWRKSVPTYRGVFDTLLFILVWIISSLYGMMLLTVKYFKENGIINLIKWVLIGIGKYLVDFIKFIFSLKSLYIILLTIIYGEIMILIREITHFDINLSGVIIMLLILITAPVWISFGECTHLLP